MSTHRNIVFCLAFFILSALNVNVSFSQARGSYDEEAIVEEVKTQLAQLCSETGDLRTFCSENKITGQFVYDLTIEGKGNVLTVFLVSSTTDEVQAKNSLKDKLYSLRFENVKLPKKERVKFRHTLNF